MEAAYVFRIRVRLSGPGVRLDPAEFETVARLPAELPPAADGTAESTAEPVAWTFFQTHCWRGETNAEAELREELGERLGVEVVSVSFSELETDRAYLRALKAAVDEEPERFNADHADEALKNHLGSSVRVLD